MPSTDPSKSALNPDGTTPDSVLAASIPASMQNLSLQDKASEPSPKNDSNASRPVIVYTLPQILKLHRSPLVRPPTNMPDLKQWFGTIELEQPPAKKDDSTTTQTNIRDRRFRRDNDDQETPSRPPYRTALSQQSQMGNFKHHPLRGAERDRDREHDKDRERDIRDKEGQERLRNLSDKYDRDRLAHPSNNLRAPNGTQTRRADVRDILKKKGESSDDWRRGVENPRTGREDTNSRREDRDRARSRPRDSSKSRREPSASRRDDRERHRRNDRDRERDDHRREKDRDRDDGDADDHRRWRDDGKRDERMAARRERVAEERDRARDKPPHEPAWEDRRFNNGEEREARPKRGTGRDRRAADDAKEDRRDREKEKEPAWMDSQAPFTSGMGILGGRSADGELDGIQAWKKGMKEKEQKEKGQAAAAVAKTHAEEKPAPEADASGKPLDEIQLFKMMMKREENKKQTDGGAAEGRVSRQALPGGGSVVTELPPKNMKLNPASSQPPLSETSARNGAQALPLLSTAVHSLDYSSTTSPDKSNITSVSNVHASIPENGNADKQPSPSSASQYNPPQGSRFLSLLNSNQPPISTTPSNQQPSNQLNTQPPSNARIHSQPPGIGQANNMNHTGMNPIQTTSSKGEILRNPQSFSPFEEHSRLSYGFEEKNIPDNNRHLSPAAFLQESETGQFDANNRGGLTASGTGSRFAKYFEGKNRDGLPVGKGQASSIPSAPLSSQRQDAGQGFSGVIGGNSDRAIEDIYAMLNNSNPRMGGMHNISPAQATANLRHNQLLLQQQQQQQQQFVNQQQLLNANGRLDPLYDSRLDDRNFVPDGMVPGLRSVPPRSRKGEYDIVDDPMQYANPRLPTPQQQRALDPLYNNGYPQQMNVGRNGGIPLQGQFRGGPSPMQNQNILPGNHQRLPPGLANLGGRPPHEPSQFVGLPGMPPGNMVQGNNPVQQQPFNNFGAAGMNYNAGNGLNGLRGHPLGHQHLPASLGPNLNMIPGVGHTNNVDPRLLNQSQMLNGFNGGLRDGNSATFGGQHLPGPASGPGFGLRQQPPHSQSQLQALSHIQQQQQQQGYPTQASNQPAHDLMALLMGGPRD